MSTIRRLVVTALTTSVVAIGGLAAAGPASAAITDCPPAYTCGWRDGNYVSNGYGWSKIYFQNSIDWLGNYSWPDSGSTANDSISSLYNNGNVMNAVWYQDIRYGGRSILLTVHESNNDLAGAGLNDALSSGRFQ